MGRDTRYQHLQDCDLHGKNVLVRMLGNGQRISMGDNMKLLLEEERANFNEHSVDQLIRELILSERQASPEEIEQIQQRMIHAPFNDKKVRVPARFQELVYQEHMLGEKSPSWLYHLTVHTKGDRQWTNDTMFNQYLEDLRQAIIHPDARLALYIRHTEHWATAFVATDAIIPESRRGADTLPQMLVAYSADRGMIVTGYQFSDYSKLNLPEVIRWVR